MRRDIAQTSSAAALARAHGLAKFEAGDLAGALEALSGAVAAGAIDAETVTVLGGLLADRGDHGAAADLYERFLDGPGADLPPSRQLDWYRLAFDTTSLAQAAADVRFVALDLLATAATANDWAAILDPDRRAAIEAAFTTPLARLDLFEQYAYAPLETGLPSAAIGQILAIGLDPTVDAETTRSAERLLHALGQPGSAYAVERVRRTARPPRRKRDEGPPPTDPTAGDLPGLTILIAGGHPALRQQIARDLTRSGVAEVRDIPPAWEAVRSGRDVRDRLSGADAAVLIGRRLAHSTANQVRSAALKSGVPVIRADTASISAVRHALERWLATRD